MFFGTEAKGALAMDVEAAGLYEIEERRHSEIRSFKSADNLLTSVLLGGQVALAIKRFSKDVWQDVQSEFLDSVKGYRCQNGSYELPGEFVTVRGVRAIM